jgi:hypothetical protein
MSFYSKKFYKECYKEHNEKYSKLQEAINEKDRALAFLMADSNTYRVKIDSTINWSDTYGNYTSFEYVDENGKYHRFTRGMQTSKLRLLTTSKESAVFKYEATKPASYWILQKAAECFAEVPAECILPKEKEIYIIKETN